MKILQINASYKPAYIYGGPTMSVSKLSEELVKAGVLVHVFTTSANGTIELPVEKNTPMIVDGVVVTYFERITKGNSHFSPRLLIKLWRDVNRYDLVHIHAWWNFVSVLASVIAFMRNVPLLVSPRGTLSEYSFNNKKSSAKKIFHGIIAKKFLNRLNLHATSYAERKALNIILQPKNIVTLPNFVKLSDVKSGEALPDHPPLKLIFLSRIEKKKGLDILLAALPLIKHLYHLTIVGDGEKNYVDELKALTIKNSTNQHVTWLGFKDESKFAILQQHHLLVLPSYNENFGNVVIESLSVGTAVLISEYVGLVDYIRANNLGWVCNNSSESISKWINEISANQLCELERIRENAPPIIDKDFNEEKLTQMYIDMYNQIILHG